MFDTKIAVIIRDDLATWQKLNVTAFLMSGITGANPEIVGKAYDCLLYTSPSPRDRQKSRMPSSA